ncbi:hypothetical protein [Methanospirillum hungatei]|uniref:hypothetical protein n=1 Tax=Methanospirillum hungatei TaxID=2203 RepID=UPI0026EF55AE|nr:hypothetical protein [Methanospirillum hungatei]MCA1916260.1 hypothetical protein [Methanospirillum hungatei]
MNQHTAGIVILLIAGILGGIPLGMLFHGDTPGQVQNNTSSKWQAPVSQPELVRPSHMLSLSNESFLVSDLYDKALFLVQANGSMQRIITRDVAKPYGYWDITGITHDKKGNIYLSDAATHRILKLSDKGSLLTSWGGFGDGDGKFDTPYGISVVNVSGEELLYVCDSGNARIQVFTPQGQYLHSLQIPSDETKKVRVVKPQESLNTTDLQRFVVTPQKGANPAFVERTFSIQSSGNTLPLTFDINRSVHLGAQKVSYQSSDVSTKNPEEWIPVLSAILADTTTQETLKTTLEELKRQANIKRISERAKLECIVHFIQQIPLTENAENRYPIEILHDKMGNTYDKALFLYGLLSEAGYDVVYLAYPGLSHAAVGIRLTDPIKSTAVATYRDSNGSIYMYINPDGPSFIGGIAQKYRKSDPFVIHLEEKGRNTGTGTGKEKKSISADHLYSTYVVESIFSLSDKYQFLVNKEKDAKSDEARNIRENYQKIKSVLDFIEKNPWNTEIAYMRIKNSKVNDIIV